MIVPEGASAGQTLSCIIIPAVAHPGDEILIVTPTGEQMAIDMDVEEIVLTLRMRLAAREKELARKRAKKKWDSLGEDGNGVLEGDELNGLAEWVWTSFHPGGKPISDREKAKLKKKLLKRIAVKHKGQMTFEDFHDWFLKTCDEIESFRALQAKHGIRKK